ncbi:hypothetical protein [Mycolicibacterium bacteremicum]|uniref:hypothetical protein n=1 Tax=Mycolicibacterium bacteremicum TaxID=564198 RepID=UPI0026F05101|nr:hypothetical protein [Mycolicibacterium bacteremicum]
MSSPSPQRIVIEPTRGGVDEFVGDQYSLVSGPLGFRFVYNETGACVWQELSAHEGGPASISVVS